MDTSAVGINLTWLATVKFAVLDLTGGSNMYMCTEEPLKSITLKSDDRNDIKP